jgi:hypothetical protein
MADLAGTRSSSRKSKRLSLNKRTPEERKRLLAEYEQALDDRLAAADAKLSDVFVNTPLELLSQCEPQTVNGVTQNVFKFDEAQIDYVINYVIPQKSLKLGTTDQYEELSSVQKENELKKKHLRDIFVAYLRARGLLTRELVSRDNDEGFILIYMPMKLLLAEAEEMKIRLPMTEPDDWAKQMPKYLEGEKKPADDEDQAFYEYDFSGEFTRKKMVLHSFEGDEDLLGETRAMEEKEQIGSNPGGVKRHWFFRQAIRSLLCRNFILRMEFKLPHQLELVSELQFPPMMDVCCKKERAPPTSEEKPEISINNLLVDGVFASWYPLHDQEELTDLRKRWVYYFWKMQPLKDVRNYFGEKIALYFAWLGHYTTWLWCPGLLGLYVYCQAIAFANSQVPPVAPSFDSLWSVPYALFIALWSTVYLEYWKRTQASCAYNWDTQGFEETEPPRPEFYGVTEDELTGEKMRDEISGQPEIAYQPYKRYAKYIAGSISILIALLVVIFSVIGIMVYKIFVTRVAPGDSFLPLTGGIMNAIIIGILNFFYGMLAEGLNDWENHKTQTEYDDKLIGKTFLFQFINSYISLFYIAYFKDRTIIFNQKDYIDHCLRDDCMTELAGGLGSILITRMIMGNVVEVMKPYVMYQYNYWSEEKSLTPEQRSAPYFRWEKEAKLSVFLDTFSEYNEMIIQFGYITLFVAAFPLAPLLALANNLLEIRTDSLKLCKIYRRPAPIRAEDIGTWFGILEIMSIICVMTNCLIISFTSNQFETVYALDIRWRFWIMIICEHAVLLFKVLLAALIPDVPEYILVARARELYQLELAVRRVVEGEPDFVKKTWFEGLNGKDAIDFESADETTQGLYNQFIQPQLEAIVDDRKKAAPGKKSIDSIYNELAIATDADSRPLRFG